MLGMLQNLVSHKNDTNLALLEAMEADERWSGDEELLALMHHILLANRFWLNLFRGRSFDPAEESRAPSSFQALAGKYRELHDEESDWMRSLSQEDLSRTVTTPFLPDRSFTIAEALMQVCMHSHGHRAQAAVKLRGLGGKPPSLDFITWLKLRG